MALNSPMILTFSLSGEGVRQIAKYQPGARIVALNLSFCMVRGVSSHLVQNFENAELLIE
jgi:hypothetical protein